MKIETRIENGSAYVVFHETDDKHTLYLDDLSILEESENWEEEGYEHFRYYKLGIVLKEETLSSFLNKDTSRALWKELTKTGFQRLQKGKPLLEVYREENKKNKEKNWRKIYQENYDAIENHKTEGYKCKD